MGSSSSRPPPAPEPIDPGKAMGEYLFGQGFTSYGGITDPRLQNRLISSERMYRPQYTALELADIGVMARGIEGGTPNPEYQQLEAQLAGLEAGAAVDASSAGDSLQTSQEIEEAARRLYPNKKRNPRQRGSGNVAFNRNQARNRESFISAINAGRGDAAAQRAAKIAQVKAQLNQTPKTLDGTPGLFDLLEEQSTRAGALQREQLQLQRESDVGALQEFAPQVVDAYRDADPYSTGLAEQQTAMAEDLYQRAEGLNPEQQRMADQQALGMAQRQGRVNDQSAVAGQILGREQYLSGLRSQAAGMGQQAFGMNRQLAGDVGMTILGRPSSSIALGGSVLGQAQQGAAQPMGPQLFDPNVGINMALQQRSQDVNYQGAMAQASASRSAGRSSMLGSLGGAALGLINPIGPCWVAREVYGPTNPKWLEFREWMLNDAPSWFRNLYVNYGERIAKFISNKPRVKSIIRKWMNTKIK